MICYVLAMRKQHLGPHVVVGYGIKIFWPGLFITSPDHLVISLLIIRDVVDCDNTLRHCFVITCEVVLNDNVT